MEETNKTTHTFYFKEINYGFIEIESETVPTDEEVIEYIKESGEACYGACDIFITGKEE